MRNIFYPFSSDRLLRPVQGVKMWSNQWSSHQATIIPTSLLGQMAGTYRCRTKWMHGTGGEKVRSPWTSIFGCVSRDEHAWRLRPNNCPQASDPLRLLVKSTAKATKLQSCVHVSGNFYFKKRQSNTVVTFYDVTFSTHWLWNWKLCLLCIVWLCIVRSFISVHFYFTFVSFLWIGNIVFGAIYIDFLSCESILNSFL